MSLIQSHRLRRPPLQRNPPNDTQSIIQNAAGLELPGELGGWIPSTCLQTLIFKWKWAFNFNPWAKFQTFRLLSSDPQFFFRSIPTLECGEDTINRRAVHTLHFADNNRRRGSGSWSGGGGLTHKFNVKYDCNQKYLSCTLIGIMSKLCCAACALHLHTGGSVKNLQVRIIQFPLYSSPIPQVFAGCFIHKF